jgi:hypothetical protein
MHSLSHMNQIFFRVFEMKINEMRS